jgi:hypothetical protein
MPVYPTLTHKARKKFSLSDLTQTAPNQWRGDCPACGYAGTFVLSRNRDQSYHGWCASCGDQDGIARALAGEVAVAMPKVDPAVKKAKADKNRTRAWAIWYYAKPVSGTLAERYLKHRGIPWLAGSEMLRFHSAVSHPGGGRYPALVAQVTDTIGNFLAIHRIYLGADGAKAKLEPTKASLGPYWGGMIRLEEYDPGKPLVIGEGIENSASLGKMLGVPAWSAVVAGALRSSVVLPTEVREVIIAADPGEVGEDAARWAKHRWQQEGKKVRIARPDPGKGDFNDIWLRGKR